MEVVKRPRGRLSKRPTTSAENAIAAKGAGVVGINWLSKLLRARPLAIMVTKNKKNFPKLLKTIRCKVNPTITGVSIAKMRKTTNGKLLIEINGGAEATEVVREEVARSLGSVAKVRRMTDEAPIEIRDLDGETTSEEVLGAVSALPDGNITRLVSLRMVYGNTKTAVVVLPSVAAKRICAVGRLRVGLVYTRVLHTELPSRCFRCLAFGHQMRDCIGTDRTSKCWSCGEEGHFGRECTAGPEKVAAFKQMLTKFGIIGDRKNPNVARGTMGDEAD